MKKILTLSIVFILIGIVVYNNSNMHVSKYMWKYKGHIFKKGYEDVLVFSIKGKDSKVYRYEWPYIYKYDKKIGYVVFCIGDRMWVEYNFEGNNVVEYVGK